MIELIEQNFDNNNENCIEFLSGERFTTVSFSNRKHINRIKKSMKNGKMNLINNLARNPISFSSWVVHNG